MVTLNVHLTAFLEVSIALYCSKLVSPRAQFSPDCRIGYSTLSILTLSVKVGSFQTITAWVPTIV